MFFIRAVTYNGVQSKPIAKYVHVLIGIRSFFKISVKQKIVAKLHEVLKEQNPRKY